MFKESWLAGRESSVKWFWLPLKLGTRCPQWLKKRIQGYDTELKGVVEKVKWEQKING
jgi:hypothetical protein